MVGNKKVKKTNEFPEAQSATPRRRTYDAAGPVWLCRLKKELINFYDKIVLYCIYLCMCVCMCVRVCVCVCVCECMYYVCMYINTYVCGSYV